MTKSDLVSAVAEEVGVSKTVSEQSVNAVFGAVKQALKNGDKLMLKGFGTFSVQNTKARVGRNPATGEGINIPAGKKVKFKPSAEFLD